MGLVADLKRFKRDRVQALPARIIAETVREFGDSLVTKWSPLGDPDSWKAPPPKDYRPGNFRSSWFLSIGAPTGETTQATDERQVHNLAALDGLKGGEPVFVCNSADHASALEHGHSRQAANGLMVYRGEFTGIAYGLAGRFAR